MNGIQFVNTLTTKQWEDVCQDSRFDEKYREAIHHPEELATELTQRVEKICAQLDTTPPTKIVVTYDVISNFKWNSNELHIHPLTFAASKLKTDLMLPEQQELYKKLKTYIKDIGVLINEYKGSNKTLKLCDSPEFKLAAKNLLLQNKTLLEDDLIKYVHILPSKVLECDLSDFIDFDSNKKFSLDTLVKVNYFSMALFKGFFLTLLADFVTPDVYYKPVMGSLALLTGIRCYYSLKTAGKFTPFLSETTKLFFSERRPALSWAELTSGERLSYAKWEILKGTLSKVSLN